MDALLLSAGEGTRLRPLTLEIPKCLLPLVNDEPILKYWIDALIEIGIDKICINVYWLKDKVIQYINTLDEKTKNRIVLHEEDYLEPVGEVLVKERGWLSDPILIINSDTYVEKDQVEKFIWTARDYRLFPMCLAVEKRDSVKGKGEVILNEEKIITDFIEKPDIDQAGYIWAGVLLMNKLVLYSYEAEELMKKELAQGILPDFKNRMIGLEVKGAIDIGESLEVYKEARQRFNRQGEEQQKWYDQAKEWSGWNSGISIVKEGD